MFVCKLCKHAFYYITFFPQPHALVILLPPIIISLFSNFFHLWLVFSGQKSIQPLISKAQQQDGIIVWLAYGLVYLLAYLVTRGNISVCMAFAACSGYVVSFVKVFGKVEDSFAVALAVILQSTFIAFLTIFNGLSRLALLVVMAPIILAVFALVSFLYSFNFPHLILCNFS